jgi:hypothetical protein
MRLIDPNQSFIPNFVNVGFWTSTEFNSTDAYYINMNGSGNSYFSQVKTIVNVFALPIKSF